MEYANISLFRLSPNYAIDENAVNNEIKKYHEKGILSNVIVDNDYTIVEGEEAFVAGTRLKLPILASSRIKSTINNSNHFPSAILLEITNRCNLLCNMCPRNQMAREELDIDINIFKKVVDEISHHPIAGLWLYNIGESMLHPQFFEMLNYLKKYPMIHPLWLSSNGVELTQQNTEKLLHSPLDFLNISLNAMDQESYKKISPKSDYNLVKGNLNYFLKRKKEHHLRKPFLRIQMVDQPEVHGQIERFLAEWGPKVDIININQLERFLNQQEIPTNREITEKTVNNFEPCKRIGRGFMYIYSNNKVNFCAVDFNCTNCIGDVSTSTIEEIWNGELFTKMYNDIKSQRFEKNPQCLNCNDRNLA